MKINVLKLTTKGELVQMWIFPDVTELRRVLGGPIDSINLFEGVQSFIRRVSEEHSLEENVFLPGIYGDIVFTCGHGSYLAGIPIEKMSSLIKFFRKERATNGKA